MRRKKTEVSRPIIRFRSMLAGTIIIGGLIAGPLLMVWKQVYITTTSVRMEKMADSLALFNKEAAALRLKCERLSSVERIEQIARAELNLDYPSSDQIVIVKVTEKDNTSSTRWAEELFTFLRKSLQGNRG